MKQILGFTTILILIVILSLQTGVSSCTKEKLVTETDTIIQVVTHTDTIILQDYPITSQLITANSWKVYEERGVGAGGNIVYYLRGGSNNTQSFDNEYITFNSNLSGNWVHNNGTNVNITWTFANAEKTKLVWTVYNTPATFSIVWENIRYRNNMLYFDQYYTDGNLGFHSHSQQIRMPR